MSSIRFLTFEASFVAWLFEFEHDFKK